MLYTLILLLGTLFAQIGVSLLQQHSTILSSALPQIHIQGTTHQEPPPGQPFLTKDLSKITEINHGDKTQPLIALTFDDGFDPTAAKSMLDTLKDKEVKATFFLKGNWIHEQKDLVDRIIKEGHELGNHSWDHPYFTKITTAKASQEIKDQEDALNQHHYLPKPYFRFPYGARTPALLSMVHTMGYTSILWDIDTLDWKKMAAKISSEALSKAHNGAIILMHLGKPESAKALPTIIDGLRSKGYTLVTISSLIDHDTNIP